MNKIILLGNMTREPKTTSELYQLLNTTFHVIAGATRQ